MLGHSRACVKRVKYKVIHPGVLKPPWGASLGDRQWSARMETLTMETDNGANQKRVLTYPGGVGKKKALTLYSLQITGR